MKDDVAIKVDHVYKEFKLPHEKNTTIKSALINAVRGKKTRTVTRQKALKDISFEIKKGEFFGIVGRNGSGKSTLLKILAGIYQPTKGTSSVNGRLVPFIELGVGFNPELTGRENVYLNGALLGFDRKEIDKMYKEIVDFAELEKFMDQKLKNYSSGMQVRLAFSMAIRAEADVLLVDEVLAVGDADFQRKCFDYFRTLKRNKKTVVFVSHDMNSVREYCDAAIMIEKSEIIAVGTADSIATKYAKLFIDEAKSKNRNTQNQDKRWGTKDIAYTKIEPEVTDKTIVIKLTAVANKAVEHVNFGFAIRDQSGSLLIGTNSVIKKKKVDKIRKGQKAKITWTFPNILKDGEYFIEPAVVGVNGEIFDQWEEAYSFQVVKEEKTPYPVNPDTDLIMEIA